MAAYVSGRRFISAICVLVLICLLDICSADSTTNQLSIDTSKYYKHDDLTQLLRDYQTRYPAIAKLHSIGKSVNKRDLWAMQISDTVGEDDEDGEPKVKLVGNMHGNEAISRQVLIYLIEYLLQSYDTNQTVRQIVDNTNIYIMPSMNPDGFEIAEEGDCSSDDNKGRYNARNIDLNRNFPDQFSKPADTPKPEPETLAMMNWITSNKFVLSGNFHGGSVVASYPFDDSALHRPYTYHSFAPDEKVLKHLAQVYSDNHRTMHLGESCPGEKERFPGGITNGNQWYEIVGGMQDYNYMHSNCFDITFELSCCKYPHASQLTKEWANNRDALVAFIQEARKAIHGYVRDEDGKAIPWAVISVEGINKNVTVSENGQYWRLLVPGTYTVTASAIGYKSKTVPEVVFDGGLENMDFSLTKLKDGTFPRIDPRKTPDSDSGQNNIKKPSETDKQDNKDVSIDDVYKALEEEFGIKDIESKFGGKINNGEQAKKKKVPTATLR